MPRVLLLVLASVLAAVIGAAVGPPVAAAQDDDASLDDADLDEGGPDDLASRVRELSRQSRQLRADVGQSHRRLSAIALELFERVDGSRVTIAQRDGVGPFYRLVEATYAIDGRPVFHERDPDGLAVTPDLAIHDGVLRPGEHTLSVVLRYVGDGGVLLRYLEGYRFVMRSSHAFVVPPGQRLRITVRTFARGPEVPYEQRLGLETERALEPFR